MSQDTQQIKFVATVAKAGQDSAGRSRKIIQIPASDLAKVQDLAGKPVLVTLTPII